MKHSLAIRYVSGVIVLVAGSCSLLFGQSAGPFRFTASLKGHTDPIYSIAISPSGHFVATGSFDRSIRLWDLATGKEARLLGGKNGHQNQVLSVAFSPDGNLLASGGSDNIVKLWEIPASKPQTAIALPAAPIQTAMTPDGKTMAVAFADGSIKIWSLPDGKPGPTLTGHAGGIAGLAFSPNGQVLVSVGEDRTLRYWNTAKGEPLAVVGAAVAPITGLVLNPGAIVTASADGLLQVWPTQPTPGKPCLPTKQASDPTVVGAALAVLANGSQILTAGKGNGVAVWNLGNATKERTLDIPAPITAVTASKNNQLVAVAHGADQQITILNFGDGSVIGRFKSPAKIGELVFHPNNTTLIATLADNRVIAWNVAADPGQPTPPEFGKVAQNFPHPAAVKSFALSSDGNTLLTIADDRQARVWKPASEQPTKGFQHPNLVDAIAFDKTGMHLATGCHDGILRVWDVAKGQATKSINAHTQPQPSPIYAIAWTPDGKQLATGSYDHSIKFWDVDSGKLVHEIAPGSERPTLDPKLASIAPALVSSFAGSRLNAPPTPGHHDQVFTLAFTKDGRYLASGSSDRAVKLWDAKTGKLVHDFPNPSLKPEGPGQPPPSHPGFVHFVRFTPDGNRLISAGTAPHGQGYLALWSVADGKLMAGQELPVGPIYSFDLTPDGKSVILGCGPKERGRTDSEAVVVTLP